MIIEVRTYTLSPGARTNFLTFFREEVVPRMEQVGMDVLGAFASVTDPDSFSYVRTFPSLDVREEQYRHFYSSEDWLGWMIDHAIGHEESFQVFLGSDATEPPAPAWTPSGVHAARFTLSTAVGPVTRVDDAELVVDDAETGTARFVLDPSVQVNRAAGRGMQAAATATLADVQVGARVLVLAEAAGDHLPVARQVVIRAAATA